MEVEQKQLKSTLIRIYEKTIQELKSKNDKKREENEELQNELDELQAESDKHSMPASVLEKVGAVVNENAEKPKVEGEAGESSEEETTFVVSVEEEPVESSNKEQDKKKYKFF